MARLMGRGPQTDCAPSASATPSPRYPLLDALRIVAMMDIVAIHVTKHYLLWGMGLPVFIIVAVALGVRKPELPEWADLPGAARKRAARVLMPWVVWTMCRHARSASKVAAVAEGVGDRAFIKRATLSRT